MFVLIFMVLRGAVFIFAMQYALKGKRRGTYLIDSYS